VATTYKPGDTVPKDGTVECTQYNGTRDRVKAGPKIRTMRSLGRSPRRAVRLAVRVVAACPLEHDG